MFLINRGVPQPLLRQNQSLQRPLQGPNARFPSVQRVDLPDYRELFVMGEGVRFFQRNRLGNFDLSNHRQQGRLDQCPFRPPQRTTRVSTNQASHCRTTVNWRHHCDEPRATMVPKDGDILRCIRIRHLFEMDLWGLPCFLSVYVRVFPLLLPTDAFFCCGASATKGSAFHHLCIHKTEYYFYSCVFMSTQLGAT